MEKFLRLVAQDLFNMYGEKLHEVSIVFPNRRAGVFFQKFLSETTNKIVWAPNVITINDLMKELSGLNVGDKISLILDLYKVYKKILKTSESFDSFYYWGEMLINDFDDIDKYLVNTKDLFQNISAEKEIEITFEDIDEEQKKIIEKFMTNLRASRDSQQKKNFVEFWKSLYPIYVEYSKNIKENGQVYEGKVYRNIAESIIENNTINISNHKSFAFIGFNVLNKCEERLFDYLKLNKLARFYWDYDNWYLKDKNHEAQYFLNTNLSRFPNALDPKYFNNIVQGKQINIVSVSSKTAQVKVIPDIIENKIENISNDTAIVLADESLLINLLNSIPDSVEGINVTMGFPVKNSQVVSLINKIYNLKRNARFKDDELILLGKDVQSFISHYLVKNFIQDEYFALQQKIVKERQIVISVDFFKEYKQIYSLVNILNHKNIGFVEIVNQVLKVLLHHFTQNKSQEIQFEKELIYHIIKETNKVIDVLKSELENVSIDIQNRIIDQVISSQSVSFVGEPIADLQIMGILESRALDFENLIILSMNEGIIPKISTSGSFIPYSLREGFGLQTIRHQDSVFSYYFFRLIQRAKNIYIVYNTGSEGMASAEPSRYLQQIKYDSTFKTNEFTYGFEIDFPRRKVIEIEKSEKILEKMNQYFDSTLNKYLSPSALNTYIDCSLQFYFKYILELRAVEEIEDSMQAMHYGNILHNTLQQIYEPYINQIIKAENIQAIKKTVNIKELIELQYKKEFNIKKNIDMLAGENSMLLNVIYSDVQKILDYDEKKSPFIVKQLEEKFEKDIELAVEEKIESLKIGGKIDRIDERNGTLEIIDYKTSNPKLGIYSIEELFDSSKKDRRKEVFQLILYASLLRKPDRNQNLCPQLYITRKLDGNTNINDLLVEFKRTPLEHIKVELLIEFEEQLIEKLQELFNPEVSFKQTEIEEKCKFCDFIDICQREKTDY
jgi:PD-(D/E)XK nuclease superfamily protein